MSKLPTPKKTGQRDVVVEFTVDKSNKPTKILRTTSEATGLVPTAHALIENGRVKVGGPGVELVSDRTYRATITFPVANDELPLPAGMALPVINVKHAIPQYPPALAKEGIAGGAILKLFIDEKANVTKTELIRTSREQFGEAALEAVSKWKFEKPARLNNKPVGVALFQLVIFEPNEDKSASWQWQVSPEPAFPMLLVMAGGVYTQKWDQGGTVGGQVSPGQTERR